MNQASLSDDDALGLAEASQAELTALHAAAAAVRDARWGRRITFSPKVFLPITNLCRNVCDYCSFRRSPGDPGEWTMSPDDIATALERGRGAGCSEALLCLGDRPESAFPTYRRQLASWGHDSTVDLLIAAAHAALDRGLLPHTNAGILSREDMLRLRPVNVSLGLMLENVSVRLCEPGMPHRRAPDKRPARRLRMLDEAGELQIPFTTGILVGIGETRRERIESLLAIRRLHDAHGHIQEVIVQGFRAGIDTPMHSAPEPDDLEIAHAVALARLILDPAITVQAPPNLSPGGLSLLLGAGLNDLGGISPVTPDYINPGHPWPHLRVLGAACAAAGFTLAPRLAVHDGWAGTPFLHEALAAPVAHTRTRLAGAQELQS